MREWKGQADWIKDDSSDHTSNHEFRLGPGRARQDKSGAGKEWFFPFSLVPRLSFRLGRGKGTVDGVALVFQTVRETFTSL